MSIGNNIKKLREPRNYTQTYLSDQLDISLSAYSKIERNETEISLKGLEQIAEILNLSVNGIMEFDEQLLLENANFNVNGLKKNQQIDPFIEQMRSEIAFLRSLLNKTQVSGNEK